MHEASDNSMIYVARSSAKLSALKEPCAGSVRVVAKRDGLSLTTLCCARRYSERLPLYFGQSKYKRTARENDRRRVTDETDLSEMTVCFHSIYFLEVRFYRNESI